MRRTGATAAALATILGFAPQEVRRLRRAAALHDIGKAAIPMAILGKPAALTASERARVERHTLIGHRMLIAVGGPNALAAARIALTHHERFEAAATRTAWRAPRSRSRAASSPSPTSTTR